jgi:hypothetical protein
MLILEGQGHPKGGDIIWCKVDTVKPISDVHLDEVHGTMTGVGTNNGLDDPLKAQTA